MKTKIAFLILYTVISELSLGQNIMLPIDSLYLNQIEKFYKNAEQFSNRAWPGMTLSPICIFRKNGPAFLYNHPNPPETLKKISDNLYMGTQAELQILGVPHKSKLTAF